MTVVNSYLRHMYSILALMIAALTLLAGCNPKGDETSRRSNSPRHGKLRVVCTTGMIADTAASIGGDLVEVTAMMGPGVDPHMYKAKESDVNLLFDAEVILHNGLHLEARLGDVLHRISGDKVVVEVASVISDKELLLPEDGGGLPDPHVWFDVQLWSKVAAKITQALIQADPDNTAAYESNLAAVQQEYSELDTYVREQISLIPEGRRVLITAHDAFRYYGRAYGIEVIGLQGISTVAEAGSADVSNLSKLIVERGIPAVFLETSISERTVRAVIENVESQGQTVVIGGELYSDAMGTAGTEAGTYPGMVRHNTDTIVKALTSK